MMWIATKITWAFEFIESHDRACAILKKGWNEMTAPRAGKRCGCGGVAVWGGDADQDKDQEKWWLDACDWA